MKLNYFIIPLVTILVATSGSWLTSKGLSSWYNTLSLPTIAPGGGVIGTVWSIIFILTMISALIVWNKTPLNPNFQWIVWLFVANAVLNVLWSYLFFYLHLTGWPIVEMIVLNLTTIALIVLMWNPALWAAILLLPYAAWVTFATYLAYQICIEQHRLFFLQYVLPIYLFVYF